MNTTKTRPTRFRDSMKKQKQQVLKLKIDIEIPFEDIWRDGTMQTVIKALAAAMPKLEETVDRITIQRQDAEQTLAVDPEGHGAKLY